VVFAVALLVAGSAFWVLLRAGPRRLAAQDPPMDAIDDASRVRLEQVLRDADRAGESRR